MSTEVEQALAQIEQKTVPMAVVDYGFKWYRTGVSARYGTRDLRHVAIYNLACVAFNKAARDLGHAA